MTTLNEKTKFSYPVVVAIVIATAGIVTSNLMIKNSVDGVRKDVKDIKAQQINFVTMQDMVFWTGNLRANLNAVGGPLKDIVPSIEAAHRAMAKLRLEEGMDNIP